MITRQQTINSIATEYATPSGSSDKVRAANLRTVSGLMLDLLTANPVDALSGGAWNLAQDGYKKTLTITGPTSVAVTISDGEEGYLLVNGAGNVLTIADTPITTSATARTLIVVSNFGGFIFAKGSEVIGPNITPPAPTNGIVDDSANLFAFTLASGYNLAAHEGRINAGTWAAVTNPISVGDVNIPIGGLEVRVKSAAGRNAGPALTNQTAFTAVGGATQVRLGGTGMGIAETALNSNVWRGSGSNTSNQYDIDTVHVINPAGITHIAMRYGSTVDPNNNNNAFIGAKTGTTAVPVKDTIGTSVWNYFIVPYSGGIDIGGLGSTDQSFSGISPSVNTYVGLTFNGTTSTVTAWTSTDGGTTKTTLGTIAGGTYPTATIYVCAGFSVPGGRVITDPKIL